MKIFKKSFLSRFHVFLEEKRMLYVNGGINETEKTQESVSDEESINVFLDQRRFEQLYGWCDQLENWLEQRRLFSERLALKEAFIVEFRKYNEDLPHQKRAFMLDAMQKVLIEMYQRLGGNLTLSPAERNRFSEAKETIRRVYHARSDIYRAFEQELADAKSEREKNLVVLRYCVLAEKKERNVNVHEDTMLSSKEREDIRQALYNYLRINAQNSRAQPTNQFVGRVSRNDGFRTDNMLAYAKSDRAKWQVGGLRILEGRLRTIGNEELVQNFLKGYNSLSDDEGREDFLKTVNGYVSKLTRD